MTQAKPLTVRRIARILAVCQTPGAASRACERIYRLARRADSDVKRAALLRLSHAFAEHRHVLLAAMRRDEKALTRHVHDRTTAIMDAVRAAA